MNRILQDPSEDNFQYYLDDNFDQNNVKILERYKKFNGMEGNTPITANQNLPYTPSGSNLPNNEDLNNDNTINELESYYEYELDLRPGQLEVGRNYIVDKVTSTQSGDEVDWYLFRIPVRTPDRVEGDISGFKSIRFMRTYLTDFEQPVVMRMANFRLVGSQWRIFQESLFERGFFEIPEPDNSNFTVGVVNIEENSQGFTEKLGFKHGFYIVGNIDLNQIKKCCRYVFNKVDNNIVNKIHVFHFNSNNYNPTKHKLTEIIK